MRLALILMLFALAGAVQAAPLWAPWAPIDPPSGEDLKTWGSPLQMFMSGVFGGATPQTGEITALWGDPKAARGAGVFGTGGSKEWWWQHPDGVLLVLRPGKCTSCPVDAGWVILERYPFPYPRGIREALQLIKGAGN